ncbi:nesprin-3 [Sorex araneus]|uniref:nesprin-3 n=1 Tax=Sorex araneus TaxID=42254 RepID=UPI00243355C0|nr:nesprin-3 [Sorex araneus]XP_054989352.1 nesprin-3 [Sorex araneus]XP_054989353.1 nesprin-3 [Sorex araneus]XP_054989354.1 nesprin-3 [Sorex araneus]
MTGQLQASFERSLADARAWMEGVQERLRLSDDTRGPLAALEARLRETEQICQLEPEGDMRVEQVLQVAEGLLAECPESKKPEVLGQMRAIKDEWEETATYMTHCHSRLEWVWLHWREYLLARDEFDGWFQKTEVLLAPPAELQLGLREKQWQLEHALVLRDHVRQQAPLLGRLLDEAAALFHRVEDPSVDESAQKQIQAQYDAIKAKAQDRVEVLQRIAQEHARFQAGVEEFQQWLKASVDKASSYLGPDSKLTTKDRLLALQDIAKGFPSGEESLSRLEEQAAGVIRNTSPLGAQKITEELERMRKLLEKLLLLSEEEQGRLRAVLESEEAWERQARRLDAELAEFSEVLQRLAEKGLQREATDGGTTEPDTEACSEDELVARWRHFSTLRAALAAEEPRVQQLQVQLKELASLPHGLDPESLSKAVVTVVQEFERLKREGTQLRNIAACGLWERFQRHLDGLQPWKDLAQKLLDITASLPDQASIHTFLPQIEASLAESCHLKERLLMLPLQAELLDSVFGPERARFLLELVTCSMRDRDLLHNSLLQRKSKLQSVLAQHEDFAAAFQSLKEKFLDLQARIQANKGLQWDLPGKQVQLLKFQGLRDEALDLSVQVEATRPFIQGNRQHQLQLDQLSIDLQALQRSLEGLVDSCQQIVRTHCTFSHQLQELRQWVAVATQKLGSHSEDTEAWGAEPREAEVEGLLAKLPEKEAHLSLLWGLGRQVVDSSSPEGGALVQEELRQLQEAWDALRMLEERLLSLLRNPSPPRGAGAGPPRTIFTNSIPKDGFLLDPVRPVPRPAGRAGWLWGDAGGPAANPQHQEDAGSPGSLPQHREDASDHGGLPQLQENTSGRGGLLQLQEDASGREGLPQCGEDTSGRGGRPQSWEDASGRGGLPQSWEDTSGRGGLPQSLEDTSGRGGLPQPREDTNGRGSLLQFQEDASGRGGLPQSREDTSGRGGLPQHWEDTSDRGGLPQHQEDTSNRGGLPQSREDTSGCGGLLQLQEDTSGRGGLPQSREDTSGHGGLLQLQEDTSGRGGLPQSREDTSDRGGLPQSREDTSGHGGLPQSREDTSGRGGLLQLQEDTSGRGGLPQSREDISGRGGLPQCGEDTSGHGGRPQSREDTSGRGGLLQTREDASGRGGLLQPREDASGRGGLPQSREDTSGRGGLPQSREDTSGRGGLPQSWEDTSGRGGLLQSWEDASGHGGLPQSREDTSGRGGLLQSWEDTSGRGGLPQSREDTSGRGGLLQSWEDTSGPGGLLWPREDASGQEGLPQFRERANGRERLPQLREDADGCGGLPQLLRSFQQWLQVENAELAKIATTRSETAKDMRTQGTRLQELETRVLEGQQLFENLLRLGPEGCSREELEDLRYQWMLYKSKLEDAGHLLTQDSPGQPAGFQATQKARRPRGVGSFSQRVWCAALPLQLLLLLFLLFLLLLPAGDERRSCARANNFARSFRLMLHYSGPPPT